MNKRVSAWLRNGVVREFQSSHRPAYRTEAEVYFLSGLDRGALLISLVTPLVLIPAGALILYAGVPAGSFSLGAGVVLALVRVYKYLTAARYGVLVNAMVGEVGLQLSILKSQRWSYVRRGEHGDGSYPRAAVERELCNVMDVFDATLVASELEDFLTTVHLSSGQARVLRRARV